jgi:hypothetical protein
MVDIEPTYMVRLLEQYDGKQTQCVNSLLFKDYMEVITLCGFTINDTNVFLLVNEKMNSEDNYSLTAVIGTENALSKKTFFGFMRGKNSQPVIKVSIVCEYKNVCWEKFTTMYPVILSEATI